ncbi:MAG: MraY family glycosyltransferase, partial [Bacteroidaceae bacterium]
FYYNVFGKADRGKKIFMGDTGSLTLGYVLSFLAVRYSMYEPEVRPYNDGAIVIAFSVLIVPVFDVVRVILLRIRNKKSPFLPDKNHIHHKFLAIGFSPRAAMLIIIAIACAFCASNILLIGDVDKTALLLVDITIWIAFHLYLDKRIKERKRN